MTCGIANEIKVVTIKIDVASNSNFHSVTSHLNLTSNQHFVSSVVYYSESGSESEQNEDN